MHVRWWLWTRNVECCTFQRKCYQGSLSVLTSCLSVREQTKIPRLCLPQKVPSFFAITETMFPFPRCALFTWALALSTLPPPPSPPWVNNPLPPQPPPLQFLCVCFVLQLRHLFEILITAFPHSLVFLSLLGFIFTIESFCWKHS